MVAHTLPHQRRVRELQTQLNAGDSMLCTSPSAVQYFTGFVSLVPSERDGLVLVTKQHIYLFHSSFSPLPNDISWITRFTGTSPTSIHKHCTEVLRTDPWTTLYIDAETLTVSEHQVLQTLSGKIKPLSENQLYRFMLEQRAHKDSSEVAFMRQAAQITASAVDSVITQLSPGMTELTVKRLLEHTMEDAGATGMAFPSIVAFGTNSALPHHQPSELQLAQNMAVLIDVGARVEGYCADMTRTIWFGPTPNPKFTIIESTVKEAYQAALKTLRNHSKSIKKLQLQSVDSAARAVITDAGYGTQFNHTTGHGLGLDIHEHPSVNWKSEVDVLPQLVITVEPGIYLEGEFGVRYENTVLIEADTVTELTLR